MYLYYVYYWRRPMSQGRRRLALCAPGALVGPPADPPSPRRRYPRTMNKEVHEGYEHPLTCSKLCVYLPFFEYSEIIW